jgi:hypothetical protein
LKLVAAVAVAVAAVGCRRGLVSFLLSAPCGILLAVVEGGDLLGTVTLLLLVPVVSVGFLKIGPVVATALVVGITSFNGALSTAFQVVAKLVVAGGRRTTRNDRDVVSLALGASRMGKADADDDDCGSATTADNSGVVADSSF